MIRGRGYRPNEPAQSRSNRDPERIRSGEVVEGHLLSVLPAALAGPVSGGPPPEKSRTRNWKLPVTACRVERDVND